MAGLLSGFGKKNAEKTAQNPANEKPAATVEEKPKEQKKIVYNEADFLFDKKYECPVCYGNFTSKTVRSGKIRAIRADKDLKPVFEQLEPIKYDVVLCPHCGYAALTRYYGGLASVQVKAIRENISNGFKAAENGNDCYTYEEALNRYKMCLANTIVKRGKTSEKAYINLKTGWLLRSMGEALDHTAEDYEKKAGEIKEQEREYLKNALDGLIEAMQTEDYPICGMDEVTYDYLIAVLAMEFEQYDVTSKLISNILVSTSASSRIKDKARDIKEELIVKVKEKKAGQS